jgi:enediyne biosynthesis protein E4
MHRWIFKTGAAIIFAFLAYTAVPSGDVRFENITDASGISFVLANSPTSRKYLPETMAGGIAAFDYNNDGRTDLFFANGASMPSLVKTDSHFSNRLYRNGGKGRFTDVTAQVGLSGSGFAIGAAAADFDNDGFPDLFVSGVHESHLYRNLGGKGFVDVTAKSGIEDHDWAVAAAWFDYDRDGLLDLFIVNYVGWSAETNPLCKAPSQKEAVYCHPSRFPATANMLFHNLGGGRFEDVSIKSGIAKVPGKGMSVAVSDYDGDGYPDLFVTNDALPNSLFHNLRDGRFAEVALDAGVALTDSGNAVSGMGADFRDIDNDGRPDILFTALTGQTFPLFRNLGKGVFEDDSHRSRLSALTAKLSGWGVALPDLNNDGWKDIFTANGHVTDNIESFSGDRYKEPNAVFVNRRDGTFMDASAAMGAAFLRPGAHRGAVIADFDEDGRLDAAVTVLSERAELWRNLTAGGNWLAFRLIGTQSNRDGIGAVVKVGNQFNEMTSSVGYASSALMPVHFGLNTEAAAPDVEIRWPSGKIQHLRNVKANQTVTIREEGSSQQ